MRSISTALSNALARDITSIGYLAKLEIPSSTQYWSNAGTLTWNSQSYTDTDFDLSGLSLNIDEPLSQVRMSVQNLDLVMSSLLLGNDLTNVPVTLYQVSRDTISGGVIPAADVATLGVWEMNGVEIGLDYAKIALSPLAARKLFAPRKRVDAANGFNFAMPVGTVITWGTEVFTIESEGG